MIQNERIFILWNEHVHTVTFIEIHSLGSFFCCCEISFDFRIFYFISLHLPKKTIARLFFKLVLSKELNLPFEYIVWQNLNEQGREIPN